MADVALNSLSQTLKIRLAHVCLASLMVWAWTLAGPPAGEDRQLALSRSVGLLEAGPHVAIRDLEIRIDAPIFPGERVVFTTVGVETIADGSPVFLPLVSAAVDYSFEEAISGNWLAVWNLGQKSPGPFNHLKAMIPGFRSRKRPDEKTLNALQKRLKDLEDHTDKLRVPNPVLDRARTFRKSTGKFILGGLKIGLGLAGVDFWPQFLIRGYLLRHTDRRNREFEQTYLGATWYSDLSSSSLATPSLSLDDLNDIKFRLLANRSALGRWVNSDARQDLVHGYENEMRDHLWGTSNRLASDAIEYHLGYLEFRRQMSSGVPLSLGGVLYYDPEMVPEPSQRRWSISNPFDLTYDPFEDPEVLKHSETGPVPLAIYTFQSNMAFKPIITVDFYRPGNPRLRESATYWRRLLNEGLASSGFLGLFYNGARRALSHAANRKGLTWLSDNKVALGIEELRLSLISQLYFEPEFADRLLDQVDRSVVNPLIQPGREQRLQAQLDYGILTRDGGRAVLDSVRRIRYKTMKNAVGSRAEQATRSLIVDYRRYLRTESDLKLLRTYAQESYSSGIPLSDVENSIRALAAPEAWKDEETVAELMRFRGDIGKLAPIRGKGDGTSERLENAAVEALRSIYPAIGRSPQDLERDLSNFARKEAERAAKAKKQELKQLASHFERRLERSVKSLDAFVRDPGSLENFSPWYVVEASEFLSKVPDIVRENPYAARKYRKRATEVSGLVRQAEALLENQMSKGTDITWLETQWTIIAASLRTCSIELSSMGRASPTPGRTVVAAGLGPRD